MGVSVRFNRAHEPRLLAMKWSLHLVPVRQARSANRSLQLRGRWKCSSPDWLIRAAIALVLLTCMLLPSPTSRAQERSANEYRTKANFLAAFPNFIEWPSKAFPSEQAPLLICVFGDFSFGTSLAEMTQTASIRGRRVEVRWDQMQQELRACHILFVSRSEAKRYGRIFKLLDGASVLTVGETPGFLGSGGAIAFPLEGDRLQFDINKSAADDVHLRISSNMLALARRVVVRTEAAKS